MSGKTALVSFPSASLSIDVVYFYEQNRSGVWKKIEEAFVHDVNESRGHFRQSLNIDKNLARVFDRHVFNLFRQHGKKWVQSGRIDNMGESACSISGDTIAISGNDSNLVYVLQLYKYDQDWDKVGLLVCGGGGKSS